jgi:hypothetical protein
VREKCGRTFHEKNYYDLQSHPAIAMHFLDNFDPETSARERRKLNRKSYFIK